ncbi:histidine--tRNA ligase [Candidatus Falkowbacteria bacterium]|nr:histidine--tRNA ligase [Candidatus Falkowbacteria bacterium]
MMKRTVKKASPKEDLAAKGKKVKTFSRLRGMRDVLFDEYKYWEVVNKKASDLAKTYGFKRVDTPIIEKMELFERASGKASDIITKEIYSFVDKNGEKVALRAEATPGLVRAYVEHGMSNLPQPVKMFWIGPAFRNDKPQAGRYRQFTQYNLEMFGEAGPVADAQLILVAFNFFRELQVDVQVQINSVGCKDCRKDYLDKLVKYYKDKSRSPKLCLECKKNLTKNPMRLLECKEEKCVTMRAEAPQLVDSLCDPCRDHFVKVLEYLDELGVNYNLEPFLVRGLEYYSRTVFEIWSLDDGSEARQAALGGGGRYDELVEYMGGRPTPACGFGIGLERTILKIKENNIALKEEAQMDVFIAQLGEGPRRRSMVLFEELRRAGFKVGQLFSKDSLKIQLEEATRMSVKFSLILGQKELSDGTILIRDMESGVQEIIDLNKVRVEMGKRLGKE